MDRAKMYRRFRTLLIANRGEIACRVIRTARAMGLRTVAVYSEADRGAMHVADADEAVLLGPARARDSYLNIERVIEAARKSGAEAVHPGYGFLSEKRGICAGLRRCRIGLCRSDRRDDDRDGLEIRFESLMEKAGVPLVPGYHGEAQDEATLAKAADKIGFPVLVKASAGGGGRGMRVVRSAAELGAGHRQRQARGEGCVRRRPHADREIRRQSAPHRGAGDRRQPRQSVVAVRARMHAAAAPSEGDRGSAVADARRQAARGGLRRRAESGCGAVNYVGAGTIEFVSDGKEVFFIEMNTRLQVEHPVTELITGINLVEWQLRVAFGEKLPLTQDQIKLNGHAIEARVYAENPAKNFMPSVGRITTWRTPDATDGLRIDDGYREGDTVSPYYDAMLAKVIAWAPTREAAIDRLNRGLEETDVRGVVTNIPFLVRAGDASRRARQRDRYRLHRARVEEPDDGGRRRPAILSLARPLPRSWPTNRRRRAVRRTRHGELLAGCRSAGGNGYFRSARGMAPNGRLPCSMATGPRLWPSAIANWRLPIRLTAKVKSI